MALESATFISQLVPANPPGSDLKSQGDDHLRMIKAVLQANFPDASKAFRLPQGVTKTANYSVLGSDDNTFFAGDPSVGSFTFTLPTMVGLTAGFQVAFFNEDETGNSITIIPASGTIDGVDSITLQFQDFCHIYLVGASWHAFIVRQNGVVTGTLYINGELIPAQIVADQHDYAPAGIDAITVVGLSSDAIRSITGIAGGFNGRILILRNVGSFPILFPANDVNSLAENRFNFSFALNPGWVLTIRYDGNDSLWKQISFFGNVVQNGDYISNAPHRVLTSSVVWNDATPQAPAFATPLTLDFSTGINFVIVPTSDFTLNFPINVKHGQQGTILIVPSGGPWDLNLQAGVGWKTPSAQQIGLSGGVDLLTYYAETEAIVHIMPVTFGLGSV